MLKLKYVGNVIAMIRGIDVGNVIAMIRGIDVGSVICNVNNLMCGNLMIEWSWYLHVGI